MDRKEEARKYADWTGATYVDMAPDGTIQEVKLSPADRLRRMEQLGQKYVNEIRHALMMKVDDIECGCADREVVEWVKEQFSPQEWANVHLTFWEAPRPQETKRL